MKVTGPISSLPGGHHALPEGTKCDEHPDRPAVARVQGETDSMGSELNDLCAECLEAEKKADPTTGTCDWCKTSNVTLHPRRDIDEGTSGRVYEVCKPCITADNRCLQEELDANEDE